MFNKSIPLGRVLGIPIRLDYSWLIIFVWLTFQLAQDGLQKYGYRLGNTEFRYFISAVTAILLFISVLLHELGHSYVALRKGIAIRSITLFIFGGVAEITQEPRTAVEELEIAAAGPLVSVAIAAVAWSLDTLNPVLHLPVWSIFILGYLAWANTIMVLFNMIPGFPLDGGRIFRAAMWEATGNLKKSTRIASIMGQAVGYFWMFVGVCVFFLTSSPVAGVFYFIIGLFLIQAAQSSYQQVLIRSALSGIKVREVMTHPVTSVNSWLTIDELMNDYFMQYRYSSFPVIDDGVLKGYVISHDAKEIPRMEWMNKRVTDILRPMDEKYTVPEEMDAIEAMTKMLRQDFHKLLVTKNHDVIGIVTLRDVMTLFKMKTDLGN